LKEGRPGVPGDGNEEYLFSTADIFLVLESQKAKLAKRVQEIAGNTLLNASEHDLCRPLWRSSGSTPVLKENERYLAHSGEVQVDVPGDLRFRKRVSASVNRAVADIVFKAAAKVRAQLDQYLVRETKRVRDHLDPP
jgi:hypothetical protein